MGDGEKTASDAPAADFSCPACGRRFVWKPDRAGRQVRCPCGAKMIYPAQMPQAAPPPDDVYDMSPVALQDAAPIAKSVAPPVLSYQPAKVGPGAALDTENLMNFQAPLWILCGGVVAELIAKLLFSHDGLHAAAVDIGGGMILGTVIQLAAMFVAAKFRGIQLGEFWLAVLKLAAVSIAPGAAFDLFCPVLRFIPLGMLAGGVGVFVLYFALLGTFFDLDQSDTWYCVMVMFIINMAVYFLVQFIH